MSVKSQEIIDKIKAGKFSIANLETLRKNALAHPDGQLVAEVCSQQLDIINKAEIQKTRERGVAECVKKLNGQGATVVQVKEGNKLILEATFKSKCTKRILVRSKNSGTWQTTISYAKKCTPNEKSHEFWIFVDLEYSTPKFYIVPSWWIANNIYECHENYLARNGGSRKLNDLSKHHAVELHRVKIWENRWELLE